MAHKVYMPASDGPFRCDHCEYWPSPNRCNNVKIMAKAKANEDGLSPDMIVGELVRVEAGGCSDFFKPTKEFTGDHDVQTG